jgi:uncharacterized membrane protein YraQ (UPF0718 family)
MKNIDYHSLLMYVSLILAVAILISIVFGCSYKKHAYREYFADAEEAASSKAVVEEPPLKLSAPKPENDDKKPLNPTEKKLKKEIEAGNIDEKKLTEMVEKKEVTTENLKNVISAFQMQLNLK